MEEKEKTEKVNSESMKENAPKEEKKKINFFKKIGYSIVKISKYDDMINLGAKSAIKYFFGLLAIASLILAIGAMIGISLIISVEGIEALGENIGTTSIFYILIYNGIINFLAYYVLLFIIFVMFILIIAVSIFLVLKILKVNFTIGQALSLTIYTMTSAIMIYIVYLLISYFINISIPYFDAVVIIIMYIYLWLFMRTKRKEWNDEFHRRSKKKSKK